MKRLTSGTILLGAVLAAAACNSVTDSLTGSATRIIATPTFLIGDTAATKNVLVQTFDDQGSPLIGAAVVSGVTGAITAAVDPNYRPGAQPVTTQILVKGTALNNGTFTVTANGLSTDVHVTVAPPAENYVGTVSDTQPPMGATITLTTPAAQPYRFTSASKAYLGAVTVAKSKMTLVGISPDSLTATFVADSVRRGLAIVDGAVLDYNMALTGLFRVASTDTVRVIPLGVTALSADTTWATGVDLTWPLVIGGAAPYGIYRSATSGGPYTLIDSTRTNVDTIFSDKSGDPLVQYYYIVAACNGATDVCGTLSPEATGTEPILAPTGLAATLIKPVPAAQDTVNLTWTAKPNVFYNVVRATVLGNVTGAYSPIGSPTASPPVFPFQDATVVPAPNTKYSYKIQACSNANPGTCGLFGAAVAVTVAP
jgi:hypothetical protein